MSAAGPAGRHDQDTAAAGPGHPLRVVQVGAGGMGRTWLRTLAANPDVELVGLVDLDPARARTAADEAGYGDVPVATSVEPLARDQGAQALVNVTVPAAHHRVSTEALLSGLPVLCEKPLAESVAEGLSMAAAAELSGRLLMVSQSRRYWRQLAAYRRQIAVLGEPDALTCSFFKAVHYPGFREEMDHPLLVDMSIHHFDLARALLGSDPISVYCESHNPRWSWFAGDASVQAVFEFAGGARFSYSASWCTPGEETSWNGSWRLSARDGTARWDGDHVPVAARGDDSAVAADVRDEPEETAGSLAEFVRVLRTCGTPAGEVHDNVSSLAMVEAAIASAAAGRRVTLAEVLERAHAEALRLETRPEVRAVLAGWPSVHAVVGAPR